MTIKTLQDLKVLQDYLIDKTLLSFDTETTGTDKGSTIIGFSVAAEIDLGFYVILEYWDPIQKKLIALETKDGAKAFMKCLIGKDLIMQNAGFDCARVHENFGIDLMPYVHTDTLLLGHLLNENRHNGLKERGVELYGEDARKEQNEMRESVYRNGGVLTKALYELYKADAELIAKYGAQDAILTLKIFYNDVPELYKQGLDKFFYDDETMPLCRTASYQMNTAGLRVDIDRLQKLKKELEVEILETQAFIYKEITPLVKDKYPGTSKAKTFNIGAGQQVSWLLFENLKMEFNTLTKGGRALCKKIGIKVPYHAAAKRAFIAEMRQRHGEVYEAGKYNPKTKKVGKPKKIGHYWQYLSTGKITMELHSKRFKWVQKLREHSKAKKLLSTYVLGIEGKMKYGIIRPQFLQHGTTSGRFSSKAPNFQNLPAGDKRVKACIIPRPGKIFVGADHSQLEPRVFASVSGDETLLKCFSDGLDFYSVVAAPVYKVTDASLIKDEDNPEFFGNKYAKLRKIIKEFALATVYGTTAFQLSVKLGMTADECQEIINSYFASYPKVELMMLERHEQAKSAGVVYSTYGRPRRIPEATKISTLYGKNTPHGELPYTARNLLNLAVNHPVQSTASSIVNRNMIYLYRAIMTRATLDSQWLEVKIVVQVHDSIVLEGPEVLAQEMAVLLKESMEKSVELPRVTLIATPKIGYDLSHV